MKKNSATSSKEEQEKKVYLLRVTREVFEPCNDFDEHDIDRLPTIATYVYDTYESARQHAVNIISGEYPANVDYIFPEQIEIDEEMEEEEGFEYEPELLYGDFCTLEENPEDKERFVFKLGYSGNSVGPCICFQCAELTKIFITEETVLP